MTRFDGDDGSGGGEDAGLLDEVRGAEVSADADVLDELGKGHHGGDVGEHARKVVLAHHRRLAKADDEVLDGRHVHELVLLDDRDLLDDDVGRLEAGVDKVGRLELLQGLLVELRLEVLEHKGEFFLLFAGSGSGSAFSPERQEAGDRLTKDLDGARVDGTCERRSPRGERDKESSNREESGDTHFQCLLGLSGTSWISPAVCVPR